MTRDGSRKKNGLKKKQSPPSSKAQSLGRASHKGKGNQKIVKNGRQTVQANHSKHMSNRQILDIHERKARARSKFHQPIPSQYRIRWGHGLEVRGYGLAVGRGEDLLWGSCSGSFGGNVLLGWHTIQKKQSWVRTTRCMSWGIGREKAPRP